MLDLSTYWKNRGKTYSEEIINQPTYVQKYLQNQENYILKKLTNIKFDSILEIGCGYGRLTNLIYNSFNIKKYTAIDISEDLISVAKNKLSNSTIDFHCIDLFDFQTSEKFDLIFTSEVLQHIESKKISNIIEKLVSFSKHKLIFVESSGFVNNSSNNYCFNHNYEDIFTKLSLNYTMTNISIPFSLKLLDKYIKMRGRTSFGKQMIYEITI